MVVPERWRAGRTWPVRCGHPKVLHSGISVRAAKGGVGPSTIRRHDRPPARARPPPGSRVCVRGLRLRRTTDGPAEASPPISGMLLRYCGCYRVIDLLEAND